MEGLIKAELIYLRFEQQLIIPSLSSHPLFFYSLFCPISPFLSLTNSPLSSSIYPSLHPHLSHSRCLGNNTKRFSLQLCHRGNAWLSSRPLLEAHRSPVQSRRLSQIADSLWMVIIRALMHLSGLTWSIRGCETAGAGVY